MRLCDIETEKGNEGKNHKGSFVKILIRDKKKKTNIRFVSGVTDFKSIKIV